MMNSHLGCGWRLSYLGIAAHSRLAQAELQTRILRGTLVVLSTIVTFLAIAPRPAQAQATFGNFGIPTPSQRFLGEGRARFEQEIRNLQTPPNLQPLLTIDDDAYIQDDLLQLEDPRFHSENIPTGAIESPSVSPGQPTTDPELHL